MNVLSGVHNHTDFSDGKHTPAEMLSRALALGFVSFGFSDHSHTPCDLSYCMKKERYAAYRDTVRDLKERFADRIEVLCGLEKDRESEEDGEGFDYLIGSVHYIAVPGGRIVPVDESEKDQRDTVRFFCGGDKLEFARRYYDAVVSHAGSGAFQIQGHFDLITKYGLFDDGGDAYTALALDALDAVLDAVPYIEVNVGGMTRLGRKDPYPAPFLLRRVLEKGGKVILAADAHRADWIDAGFETALSLLKKIGFEEVYRLRAAGFEKLPL